MLIHKFQALEGKGYQHTKLQEVDELRGCLRKWSPHCPSQTGTGSLFFNQTNYIANLLNLKGYLFGLAVKRQVSNLRDLQFELH